MADSISTQESCVCVFAHRGIPLRQKPTPDHFFIQVMLSSTVVSDIPSNPRIPFSRTYIWTRTKLLEFPRQAFLSTNPDEQGDIVNKMIESLEIPFPLKNTFWATVQYYPTESEKETLEEIKSRLLSIAREQAGKDESEGHMSLNIKKVEKLSPDDYREFCAEKERRQRKGMNRTWCTWFRGMLTMLSPKENKCFGLELVELEEESGDENSCPICWDSLKKGCQVMRMPCSHIFHEFCILWWIVTSPTCPLCRFELVNRNQWRDVLIRCRPRPD